MCGTDSVGSELIPGVGSGEYSNGTPSSTDAGNILTCCETISLLRNTDQWSEIVSIIFNLS